ncbi:MAG: MBL fold metallo-hydrolase [bacterium]|nr:MBL fold metallo-hydrolase [bacterium]
MTKTKYSKIWYLIGALLAANIAAHTTVSAITPRNYAALHFFDVGQGDGIYLRTIGGNDVLVDTGPGDVILSKLGRVMPFWDRTIEFVVLTHPHADHISGMIQVLKRYEVKAAMIPEVDYDSQIYNELLRSLKDHGVEVVRPKAGQRILLDQSTVLDIYFPILENVEAKDINDTSIVSKLSFGNLNVLLTGDAGKDVEEWLIAFDFPIESEILKVGHHGSRHSSAKAFLDKTSSTYNVISVGKNSYGHPHEEVLGLFADKKAQILRTDERGDVVFEIYPDEFKLRD